MKKSLLPLLLTLLTFTATAQTAEEIITKHLEAVGAAAWDTITTLRMESKVASLELPGMEILKTMTVVHHKAAYFEASLMGVTNINCIYGDTGWSTNPIYGKPEAKPKTAEQVNEMKSLTELNSHLYNYKAKGFVVEYLGFEDLDGTLVHKIKTHLGANQSEIVFIDPVSGYHLKKISVVTDGSQEYTAEEKYSDFKKVGDLVIPFTKNTYDLTKGKTIVTITDIKINVPVDEKMFEMPGKR